MHAGDSTILPFRCGPASESWARLVARIKVYERWRREGLVGHHVILLMLGDDIAEAGLRADPEQLLESYVARLGPDPLAGDVHLLDPGPCASDEAGEDAGCWSEALDALCGH